MDQMETKDGQSHGWTLHDTVHVPRGPGVQNLSDRMRVWRSFELLRWRPSHMVRKKNTNACLQGPRFRACSFGTFLCVQGRIRPF